MKKFILVFVFATTTALSYSQNISTAASVKELLQGKWQDVEETTHVLMFENNVRKEISEGDKNWDIETFILSSKCLNDLDIDNDIELEKDKYITCKESDLCWYIEFINKDFLTLRYMGRGNLLKYKRVK